MLTIVSGTNRPNSRSLSFSLYYQELLKGLGQESGLLDLANMPPDYLVSALYANSGKNEVFNVMRKQMEVSAKYIFVVPEYNGSFPGVLKAFIDGLKFPDTFRGKKAALVGISQGNMGGALALSHLSDILNYMGMNVLAIKPRITSFSNTFVDGKLTNSFLKGLVDEQAKALIEF